MRTFHSTHSSGFTLIELIIVFSILAIISTIGIASFVGYTNSQKLRNATLDIKTMLQQARSQSQSQTTSCANGTTFQGYAVQLCCSAGGLNCPPNCAAGNVNDVELDVLCSGTYTTIPDTGKKFPQGVTIDNIATTQRSFLFIPISGGVGKVGKVVLSGVNNAKQTITVTSTGIIQ